MRKLDALLAKAERFFDAADLLLEADSADFAVFRAYPTGASTLRRRSCSRRETRSRHGQVIAQFGRHFAKEDRMDRRFNRLLDEAFSARQLADYAAETGMDAEEMSRMIDDGREFLAARKRLGSQGAAGS